MLASAKAFQLGQSGAFGDAFAELSTGVRVAWSRAPDWVDLPDLLRRGSEECWQDSLPGGRAVEQGGILFRCPQSGLEWKRAGPGCPSGFVPNYEDRGKHQAVTTVVHTHPYGTDERGGTHVSFSQRDLSRLVTMDEPTHLVQSGEGQFLVARTLEFDNRVRQGSTSMRRFIQREMDAIWVGAFKANSGCFQQRVDAAVRAVCHRFAMLYYRGAKGCLRLARGPL